MNVIEGQANRKKKFSLIFYSLTFNNILNIIVMLILVGVTISVSLNGGLFETATKAATGTQKEKERERLTEVALASYNVSESKISDVDSLVGKLSGMGFSKDESKSSVSNAKLVVQGKSTLWQIDLITAKVEPYRETYTFTVGELGDKGLLVNTGGTLRSISASSFWRDDASDDIKNSGTQENFLAQYLNAKAYNITCSDPKYSNRVDAEDASGGPFSFWFLVSNDGNTIIFNIRGSEEDDDITNDNYQPYADLAFTISMPE